MKRTYLLVALLSFLTFAGGCAPLIVGGGVAASTYALTGGTIAGNFDRAFDTIWFKADEVLDEIGEITFSDEKKGQMTGLTSEGITVTIQLERITENTTNLKVSAKKGILTKRKEAQEIFSTIIRRI